MSSCSCEDSRHYRVTGEVVDADGFYHGESVTVVGGGKKVIRVRCGECGGKVAYVGSDLLNILGIPDSEIYPGGGAGLPEDSHVHLEVDLW